MNPSKLSTLIRSTQSQVSKSTISLKQAEEKSAALEAIYRSAKALLKEAKEAIKKAKSDWKSSQVLVVGERKPVLKLQRELGRLRRKARKASVGSGAAKSTKAGSKRETRSRRPAAVS